MAVSTKSYNAFDDLEALLLAGSENCYFYQVNNYDGKTIIEVNASKKPFDKKCMKWGSEKVLKDIKERTSEKLQRVKIVKDIGLNDVVRINIYIGYLNNENKPNDIVVKLFYDEISDFKWID